MSDHQILAFAAIALILTVTPGPDTFLVVGNTISRGVRAGFLTTLGIASGGLFHAALAGLGLSRLLVYSEPTFHVVKLMGAAYLFYLGAKALLSAWQRPEGEEAHFAAPDGRRRSCYLQGLLTNILNPKVAAFYLAFLPQFIQPDDNVAVKSALLVAIHYGMSLVWLSVVALSVGRMSGFLSRSRVRRWLDGVVGGVMMAFGLRLALARD